MRARGLIAGLIVAAATGVVAWLAWPGDGAPDTLEAGSGEARSAGPAGPLGSGESTEALERHAAQLPGTEATARNTAASEPPREPRVRYLRVVDEDGRPAPRARLLVFNDESIDTYDWEDYRDGGKRVDAWGRYTIDLDIENDVETRWLALGPNDRCSDVVQTPEGNGDFTLVLRAGNLITGVVRDTLGGDPVAGATVVLAMGTAGASTWPPTTITGADGRYRFAGLPPRNPCIPIVRDEDRYGGPDVYDDYELWGWDASGDPTGAEEPLESMLARGRASRFTRTGQTAEIDLRVSVTPGQEATLRLTLPNDVPPDSVVACRWRKPSGRSPAAAIRRLHCDRGKATWSTFLPAGSNTFEFVANGARVQVAVQAAAGRGAALDRAVTLAPTRPLVIQFVDNDGAPRREAGLTLHYAVAGEPAVPMDRARPELETDWATRPSGEDGRVWYPEPPAFWEAAGGVPRTLFLAAGGADLFTLPSRGLSLSHRPFPIAAFAGALAEAGREPVVLNVPARAWAPIPVRVVDHEGRPLGGIRLRAAPASAFAGTSPWITDATGRTELRLRSVRALPPDHDEGTEALLAIGTPELFGQVAMRKVITRLRPAPHTIRGGRFYAAGVHTLIAVPARTIDVLFTDHAGKPAANTTCTVLFRHDTSLITLALETDPFGRAALKVPATRNELTARCIFASGAVFPFTLAPGTTQATLRALAPRKTR